MTCSGEMPDAAQRHPWRLSVSDGQVWSRLQFNGDINTTLLQRAVALALSRRIGKRFTVLASVGALYSGDIDINGDGAASFHPGVIAAAGLTWQILDGTGRKPFVTLSGVLSGAVAPTEQMSVAETATYGSVDIKAIVVAGYTFWGRLSPYIGASVFGGPIFWSIDHHADVGTDRSHYQVLAGISLALPARLDLFVEGSPLGEQALTGGLGLSF